MTRIKLCYLELKGLTIHLRKIQERCPARIQDVGPGGQELRLTGESAADHLQPTHDDPGKPETQVDPRTLEM